MTQPANSNEGGKGLFVLVVSLETLRYREDAPQQLTPEQLTGSQSIPGEIKRTTVRTQVGVNNNGGLKGFLARYTPDGKRITYEEALTFLPKRLNPNQVTFDYIHSRPHRARKLRY